MPRLVLEVPVIVLSIALASCAANPPEATGAVAPAPAAAPVAAAASDKPATSRAGYRLVTRNGEQVYCRREAVTGSLTRVQETCLTQAELEARMQSDQGLVDDIRSAPNTQSELATGRQP